MDLAFKVRVGSCPHDCACSDGAFAGGLAFLLNDGLAGGCHTVSLFVMAVSFGPQLGTVGFWQRYRGQASLRKSPKV